MKAVTSRKILHESTATHFRGVPRLQRGKNLEKRTGIPDLVDIEFWSTNISSTIRSMCPRACLQTFVDECNYLRRTSRPLPGGAGGGATLLIMVHPIISKPFLVTAMAVCSYGV